MICNTAHEVEVFAQNGFLHLLCARLVVVILTLTFEVLVGDTIPAKRDFTQMAQHVVLLSIRYSAHDSISWVQTNNPREGNHLEVLALQYPPIKSYTSVG